MARHVPTNAEFPMQERHEAEQYFWDEATVARLADVAQNFALPCCLCAPMLGVELEKRGVECATLDFDERFDFLRGFRKFDLEKPRWTGEKFGLIVCDPPFWNVSFSQLFNSVRLLANFDLTQPLLICTLARRGEKLRAAFADFGLEPTGWNATYRSVVQGKRNEIEFWGNLRGGSGFD